MPMILLIAKRINNLMACYYVHKRGIRCPKCGWYRKKLSSPKQKLYELIYEK